jgi:hypothetical protein
MPKKWSLVLFGILLVAAPAGVGTAGTASVTFGVQ